jgi:hypothetical protein
VEGTVIGHQIQTFRLLSFVKPAQNSLQANVDLSVQKQPVNQLQLKSVYSLCVKDYCYQVQYQYHERLPSHFQKPVKA